VNGRILQGPFLTRAQAARRARVPSGLVLHRPDLLRVEGRWLQEAYFAFQFDLQGVRPELGAVVQDLKREYPDIAIADWLVRPSQLLGYSTPLKYLKSGGAVEKVMAASVDCGPLRDEVAETRLGTGPIHPIPDVRRETAPRRRSRSTRHRPVFGSR
jgi:hypothetical protein